MARSFPWIRTSVYAHRGLFGARQPENSLSAARSALQAGYGIECDVRITSDGIPVVFHDKTLARLTENTSKIHKTASETVLKSHLAGSDETVPALSDFLSLIDGSVPVLIELKTSFKRPVARLMRALCAVTDTYKGDYAIMSFDPRAPAWLRRHRSHVCRGMVAGRDALTNYRVGLLMKSALKRSVPDFLAVDHHYLSHSIIEAWRESQKTLLTWTIRSGTAADDAVSKAHAPIFEKPYDPATWQHREVL